MPLLNRIGAPHTPTTASVAIVDNNRINVFGPVCPPPPHTHTHTLFVRRNCVFVGWGGRFGVLYLTLLLLRINRFSYIYIQIPATTQRSFAEDVNYGLQVHCGLYCRGIVQSVVGPLRCGPSNGSAGVKVWRSGMEAVDQTRG